MTPTTPALLVFGLFNFAIAHSKIDTHAHFVPDFYAEALRDAGHNPGPEGMPFIPTWSPEEHLQFMERNNITKSYLSISSPGVYLNVPSREATEKATQLSRRVNKLASEVKCQYPDKFGFFASLPLPDIDASLAEIEYSFNQLEYKPDGVVFMSNFYGMYLGDPALEPVYKALDALNITVFEHPTTPCTQFNADTFDTDGPAHNVNQSVWAARNRPLTQRITATPMLEFPFDSARTFFDIVLEQIPDKFPNIKWIIPHAGGGLIPTFDRVLDLAGSDNFTESSLKDILGQRVFFDLSGPWPVTAAVPPLLRWVDYTRILYGSDVPWAPFNGEATATFDRDIEEALGNDKARYVRDLNAERLFPTLNRK